MRMSMCICFDGFYIMSFYLFFLLIICDGVIKLRKREEFRSVYLFSVWCLEDVGIRVYEILVFIGVKIKMVVVIILCKMCRIYIFINIVMYL